jgi:hypothetical protein
MGAEDCACCKTGEKVGVQCGYPMHNYCQPKVGDGKEQQGCEGSYKEIDVYKFVFFLFMGFYETMKKQPCKQNSLFRKQILLFSFEQKPNKIIS